MKWFGSYPLGLHKKNIPTILTTTIRQFNTSNPLPTVVTTCFTQYSPLFAPYFSNKLNNTVKINQNESK